MRRLAPVAVLSLSLAVGCAPSPEPTDTADSLLSESEFSAAITSLDSTIAILRSRIAELQTQIDSLEWQADADVAQVDSVVAQIEQRKAEVEDEYNRKRQAAIILCGFGYCDLGAVSLAMALNDDARLNELNSELAQVTQQRNASHGQLAAYQSERRTLSTQLDKLQATETHLVSLLKTSDAGGEPIVQLSQRYQRLVDLHDNLGSQCNVLSEIRSLASALVGTLDATVSTVKAAAARADQLASDSREEFYKLLEMATAGDVNAEATKWLEDWVAQKTKDLLRKTGWPASDLVEYLALRAYPNAPDGADAEALREKLRVTYGVSVETPTQEGSPPEKPSVRINGKQVRIVRTDYFISNYDAASVVRFDIAGEEIAHGSFLMVSGDRKGRGCTDSTDVSYDPGDSDTTFRNSDASCPLVITSVANAIGGTFAGSFNGKLKDPDGKLPDVTVEVTFRGVCDN